jgi:predicted DNA-binding protein (MmcQ/YjbR family)
LKRPTLESILSGQKSLASARMIVHDLFALRVGRDSIMNRKDFDAFCATLPATTHVIQWGDSSVWKVGGKIFAIASWWGKLDRDCISFKCADMSFDILCELPGIAPAPYMARAKWVQLQTDDALSDTDIKSYLEDAHALIAAKLTRKLRTELGLL